MGKKIRGGVRGEGIDALVIKIVIECGTVGNWFRGSQRGVLHLDIFYDGSRREMASQ